MGYLVFPAPKSTKNLKVDSPRHSWTNTSSIHDVYQYEDTDGKILVVILPVLGRFYMKAEVSAETKSLDYFYFQSYGYSNQ
jgi:hypothetical protein